MTGDVKDHVEKLLRSGARAQAVQYLQESFNVSFEEANILVEALARERAIPDKRVEAPVRQNATTLDGPLKTEVGELLKTGGKIKAVRVVRMKLNIGLREALVLVEEVAREANPDYVSFNLTGCLQVVAKGIGIFLMIVGVFFLGGATITYFIQSASINNSDRVTGEVIEMKSLDTGESAPVVGYEWDGNKRSYESTYYTSPSDYQVGQDVFLFVNRDNPEDITIDNFSERWGLIVGLGIIGGFLLLISMVFLYFGRKKF